MTLIAIFFGGFLGGLGRWALARWPGGRPGTFAANLVGSVLLGFFAASATSYDLNPVVAAFGGAGVAGALSTWSTFASELADLYRAKKWRELWRYLLATVILGVIAAWRGTIWAGRVWGA